MQSGKVRSLNLATAVGIVLYQALEQLGQTEAAARAGELTGAEEEKKPAPRRRRRPRRGPA
jgi:tRNA C32,U32 (ribose-2'-O)-methylase TrmJ